MTAVTRRRAREEDRPPRPTASAGREATGAPACHVNKRTCSHPRTGPGQCLSDDMPAPAVTRRRFSRTPRLQFASLENARLIPEQARNGGGR